MTIEVFYAKEGDVNIVNIKGKFLGADADGFIKQIDAHFASEENTKIVIDLSGLEYIGSQGASSLMALASKYQIKIACVPPLVQNTFSVLNFDQIFKIYKSAEEAIADFTPLEA